MSVKDLELPDLLSAAARATINEQAAMAYLHDVRGSMQALFGAFELLARSAKAGSDTTRLEKVCDLAKRAINNHEKSTIEMLDLLTLRQIETAAVDVGAMLSEVAHFLRQAAAAKEAKLLVSAEPDLYVETESTKLQTLLVGLISEAIEDTPAGAELRLSADRRGSGVVISIGSALGYGSLLEVEQRSAQLPNRIRPRDLTLMFARHFLSTGAGRLEIVSDVGARGALNLHYPRLVPA
jgi:signal transduction histidine kinase